MINSTEVYVQVIQRSLGVRFLEARDGFKAPMDSPDVVLLQLFLHISLVVDFSVPDPPPPSAFSSSLFPDIKGPFSP